MRKLFVAGILAIRKGVLDRRDGRSGQLLQLGDSIRVGDHGDGQDAVRVIERQRRRSTRPIPSAG